MVLPKRFVVLTLLLTNACSSIGMAQGFFNAVFFGERTRIETLDGPFADDSYYGQLLAGSAPEALAPVLDPAPHYSGIILFGGQVTMPGMITGSTMYFRIAVWDRNRFGEIFANVPQEHIYYTGLGDLQLEGGLRPGQNLRVDEPAIVPPPHLLMGPEEGVRGPTQPTYNAVYHLTLVPNGVLVQRVLAQTFRSPFTGALHSVEIFIDGFIDLAPQSLQLAVHEVLDGVIQPEPWLEPWTAVDVEKGNPRFMFKSDLPPLIRGRQYAIVVQGSARIHATFTDVYPSGELIHPETGDDVLIGIEKLRELQFNIYPHESEDRLELMIQESEIGYLEGEPVELRAMLQQDLHGQLERLLFYDEFELIETADSVDGRVRLLNPTPGHHPLSVTAVLQDGTEIHSNVKSLRIRPANDDFRNAALLEGFDLHVFGTLLGATHESMETAPNREEPVADVWYRWTPPADGMVIFGSKAGDTPVQIFVFEEGVDGKLQFIDFNPMHVDQGRPLILLVANDAGQEGNFTLTLDSATKFNDRYEERYFLTKVRNELHASNELASREFREPDHAGESGGGSLWWTWQAEADGLVRIRLLQSEIPLAVAAYQQTRLVFAPYDLQEVASKSFTENERDDLMFHVRIGEHYDLAVDGIDGARGLFTLEMSMPFAEGMHPMESTRLQPSASFQFDLEPDLEEMIVRVEYVLDDGQTGESIRPPFQWTPPQGLQGDLRLRTKVYDAEGGLLLDHLTRLLVEEEPKPCPPQAVSARYADQLYFRNRLGELLVPREPPNLWLNSRIQPIPNAEGQSHWADVFFHKETHFFWKFFFDHTHYLTSSNGRLYRASNLDIIEPFPEELANDSGWMKLAADGNSFVSLSGQGQTFVNFDWRLPLPKRVERWSLITMMDETAITVGESGRVFRWRPSSIYGRPEAEALNRMTEEFLPKGAGSVKDLQGPVLLTKDQQVYVRSTEGNWRRLPLPREVAGWVAISERGVISNDGRLFNLSQEQVPEDRLLGREMTLFESKDGLLERAPATWLSVGAGETLTTGVSESGQAYAWGADADKWIHFRYNYFYPFPYPLRLFENLYGERPPRLKTPRNGTSILAGRSVRLSMESASLPEGTTRVEYFAGTNRIGVVDQAPYAMDWMSAEKGPHQITAMVYDEHGFTHQSTTSWLSVFDRFFLEPVTPVVNESGAVVLPIRVYNPTGVAWTGFEIEILNPPSPTGQDSGESMRLPVARTVAPYSEVSINIDVDTDHPELWKPSNIVRLRMVAQNIEYLAPPQIREFSVDAEGRFELRFTLQEGVLFHVEASDDLRQWERVSEYLTGTGETQIWSDSNGLKVRRYYRLVESRIL